MPLHILRIQCWGFEPKDYIPTFPFIFPWDVLAHASALAAVSLMLLQDCRMNQTPIRANLPGRVRSRNDIGGDRTTTKSAHT